MQRKFSTIHRKHFEQLVSFPHDRDTAVLNQDQPALVHSAWAGWQYEVPVEQDVVQPSRSVREVQDLPGRSDRVIAEFRVKSADEAATRVSEAVALAELEAYAEQTRGVLVTRHDFDLFSVALSSLVPFGVTAEHDSAGRPRHFGRVDP